MNVFALAEILSPFGVFLIYSYYLTQLRCGIEISRRMNVPESPKCYFHSKYTGFPVLLEV